MRVHVVWPLLLILTSGLLLVTVVYQRSWIPDYGEAEPLFPIAAEFGEELVNLSQDGVVAAADIEKLIQEERFAPIQPYGIVFSGEPDFIVSIRVNKRYTFDIDREGQPHWGRKY